MRDSRRKGDFENSNEESNGNSTYEEENQLPKCGRKGDAENLNEKKRKTLMKRKRLEYVSVGEKVKLINTMRKWGDGHPHQKIHNVLLILKKTKEENRLENSKRKLKQDAFEWGYLDMQAKLRSFMYVDRSLRAKKVNFIDELNFKKCMQLKILLKTKFFVGITNIQRK